MSFLRPKAAPTPALPEPPPPPVMTNSPVGIKPKPKSQNASYLGPGALPPPPSESSRGGKTLLGS